MTVLQYDGQLKLFDITIPADMYADWKTLAKALRGYCSNLHIRRNKVNQQGMYIGNVE